MLSVIDFEWIVIAMAFIAFVRWIIEQATGRGSSPERQSNEDESEGSDPWDFPQEGPRSKQAEDSAGDGGSPVSEIRRFLEALGGEPVEAPSPVGTREVAPPLPFEPPPPLPVDQDSRDSVAVGNVDPDDYYGQVKEDSASFWSEVDKPSSGSNIRQELQHILTRPTGLKVGFALKTVLGPPRGLQ